MARRAGKLTAPPGTSYRPRGSLNQELPVHVGPAIRLVRHALDALAAEVRVDHELAVVVAHLGVVGDVEPGVDPFERRPVLPTSEPVSDLGQGCPDLREAFGPDREDLEVRRRPDVAEARRDRADSLNVKPERGTLLVEAAVAVRIPIGLGDVMELVVDALIVGVRQVEELLELRSPRVSDEGFEGTVRGVEVGEGREQNKLMFEEAEVGVDRSNGIPGANCSWWMRSPMPAKRQETPSPSFSSTSGGLLASSNAASVVSQKWSYIVRSRADWLPIVMPPSAICESA